MKNPKVKNWFFERTKQNFQEIGKQILQCHRNTLADYQKSSSSNLCESFVNLIVELIFLDFCVIELTINCQKENGNIFQVIRKGGLEGIMFSGFSLNTTGTKTI